MKIDSAEFAALPALSFAASGAVWAGGYFAFHRDLVHPEMSPLVPAVAGYLIVGVLLIGMGREHLPQILALLWFAAITLLLVILIQTDPPSGWFPPLVASVIYGSLAFIGWVGFGGAIWALLKGAAPRV